MTKGMAALGCFCACVAVLAGTAFATAQEQGLPPDMSSAEIIPLEKVLLPIEQTLIVIEGLAIGTVASVSPLAEQGHNAVGIQRNDRSDGCRG
jgi:hypothetical protein